MTQYNTLKVKLSKSQLNKNMEYKEKFLDAGRGLLGKKIKKEIINYDFRNNSNK